MLVSFPGKIILMGEHAVLEGAPALALPFPGLLHARWSPADKGGIRLIPPINDDRMESAIASLEPVSIHVEWESPLPPGSGLGHSAAFSCLLATASTTGHPPDSREIHRRTHELECHFHGQPSGIDAAVICRGAPVLLQKPKVQVFWPFCRTILDSCLWEVDFSFPWMLAVGFSGKSADTREMIRRVQSHKPDGFVRRSADLFEGMVHALEVSCPKALGNCLTRAHELLVSAGAGTTELDDMVQLALDHGACGAKLTGSGGGGCVIALCRSKREWCQVAGGWKTAGKPVLPPVTGEWPRGCRDRRNPTHSGSCE